MKLLLRVLITVMNGVRVFLHKMRVPPMALDVVNATSGLNLSSELRLWSNVGVNSDVATGKAD